METMNDELFLVLIGIRDHKSYRYIASDILKSIGTVQTDIVQLQEMKFIEKANPEKVESKPWHLTDAGRKELQSRGISVFG